MTLIERLNKVTGPVRELDEDIARFLGWTQHSDEDDPVYGARVSLWWAEPGEDWSTCNVVPYYTSSIDAALALTKNKDAVLKDALRWLNKRFDLHIRFWPEELNYQHWLAIAICIVALEEREKQ